MLSVPKYDFNWQTYYMFREPLKIPAGSKIVSSAWYDNSPETRQTPTRRLLCTGAIRHGKKCSTAAILYSPNDRQVPIARR